MSRDPENSPLLENQPKTVLKANQTSIGFLTRRLKKLTVWVGILRLLQGAILIACIGMIGDLLGTTRSALNTDYPQTRGRFPNPDATLDRSILISESVIILCLLLVFCFVSPEVGRRNTIYIPLSGLCVVLCALEIGFLTSSLAFAILFSDRYAECDCSDSESLLAFYGQQAFADISWSEAFQNYNWSLDNGAFMSEEFLFYANGTQKSANTSQVLDLNLISAITDLFDAFDTDGITALTYNLTALNTFQHHVAALSLNCDLRKAVVGLLWSQFGLFVLSLIIVIVTAFRFAQSCRARDEIDKSIREEIPFEISNASVGKLRDPESVRIKFKQEHATNRIQVQMETALVNSETSYHISFRITFQRYPGLYCHVVCICDLDGEGKIPKTYVSLKKGKPEVTKLIRSNNEDRISITTFYQGRSSRAKHMRTLLLSVIQEGRRELVSVQLELSHSGQYDRPQSSFLRPAPKASGDLSVTTENKLEERRKKALQSSQLSDSLVRAFTVRRSMLCPEIEEDV